jgi:hypothetical protein
LANKTDSSWKDLIVDNFPNKKRKTVENRLWKSVETWENRFIMQKNSGKTRNLTKYTREGFPNPCGKGRKSE